MANDILQGLQVGSDIVSRAMAIRRAFEESERQKGLLAIRNEENLRAQEEANRVAEIRARRARAAADAEADLNRGMEFKDVFKKHGFGLFAGQEPALAEFVNRDELNQLRNQKTLSDIEIARQRLDDTRAYRESLETQNELNRASREKIAGEKNELHRELKQQELALRKELALKNAESSLARQYGDKLDEAGYRAFSEYARRLADEAASSEELETKLKEALTRFKPQLGVKEESNANPADQSQFTKGQRVRQNGVIYEFDGQKWSPVK